MSPKAVTVKVALKAALAAVALYWAATAVYTGAKGLSLPFNGPVEQYVSTAAQERLAAAVGEERLRAALASLPARPSALELIHACHGEVARAFSVSEGDSTGVEKLLATKRGVCFDFCGATYALALRSIRLNAALTGLEAEMRWARGYVSPSETLETAHSWLEAAGQGGAWRAYDAGIDAESPGAEGIRRMLLSPRCVPLSYKQSDVDGRVRTSLAWRAVMAGGKNPVDEALTRTGVSRAAALPLKAALLAALFAASAMALGAKRGGKGDAPPAPGARDKCLDTSRDGGVY